MKVLIISGTNHKGSTYHTARLVAEKITSADNISEVFLPRDFDQFCLGCTSCFGKGDNTCPHYDRLRPITEKIDAADVIIMSSPVYVYHATGQMKALLDHYGWRWMVHRPDERMFSKQAVIVATAAGAGMKSTIKDMAGSCFFWGIPKTYKLGMAVRAVSWDTVDSGRKAKLEKKTDSIAKKILRREGKVRVPLKTKGFFNLMRLIQRSGWNKTDVDYWKEKGWTGKKRPWK
jgi:multimeric flavodoxin WrbA